MILITIHFCHCIVTTFLPQIGICMANFLYLVNKSQLAERFDVSAVFFN